MKSNKVEKAFTLIELLVVVSIIALLVSILLPSLSKAREQAKMVVCRSNLRQVGLALLFYADAHDDHHPPQADLVTGNKPWTSPQGQAAHETSWNFRLAQYLDDNDYKYEPDPQKNLISPHPFICPSQKNVKTMKYYKIGYGTNYGTLFRYAELHDDPAWPGPTRLSQIRQPGNLMAIMDSGSNIYPDYPSTFVYTPYQIGGNHYWPFHVDTNQTAILDSMDAMHPFNGAKFVHDAGRRINVAFVDGHSESLVESEWVRNDRWNVDY